MSTSGKNKIGSASPFLVGETLASTVFSNQPELPAVVSTMLALRGEGLREVDGCEYLALPEPSVLVDDDLCPGLRGFVGLFGWLFTDDVRVGVFERIPRMGGERESSST